MAGSDLKPFELMQGVVDFLERESVAYRVVGSMASIAYGEPRFTNDVDILADLAPRNVEAICQEFSSPDFYISEQAVRDAIRTQRQFNIIHPESGLKVDIFLPVDTEFSKLDISKGQRIVNEGHYNAMFASAENVILKKLIYYKDGGSEKHLRDIAGMLLIQKDSIEFDYLNEWAERLGIREELRLVTNEV